METVAPKLRCPLRKKPIFPMMTIGMKSLTHFGIAELMNID